MPTSVPLLAVLFDRDGVLIEDTNFPINPIDLRWTPGAIDLIRHLNGRGIKVGVATNQSGVARGLFDEAAVQRFHGWMQDQLKTCGAWVDRFEYCPHHPTEGHGPYRMACGCRKPAPGMLTALLAHFEVPASRALMVGDRPTDVEAAERAGVAALRFAGGNLMAAVQAAGWLSPS